MSLDSITRELRSFLRRQIPLFKRLEIETCSMCNRSCPNCIRNSHPNRAAVQDWFQPNLMPAEMFERIMRQACDLGFRGSVCLQHYNEPLMDDRIEEFGRFARGLACFSEVFISTNADYITEARARKLDGTFDMLLIALYLDEPKKTERERWLRAQFSKTKLEFTGGAHIPTHFSPEFDVTSLAQAHVDRPCSLPLDRLIINHRGDMLLCCDDVVGNFALGNVKRQTLHELWFGARHQQIVNDLLVAGGRRKHAYCATCPRP
jgi:sulfatase maturation enzyme AslB (radical SAM superfamily)